MLHQIIEEIIYYHGYTIKGIAKEAGLSTKTIYAIKAKKIVETRNKTTNKLLSLYFSLQYQKTSRGGKSKNYFYPSSSKTNKYYIEDAKTALKINSFILLQELLITKSSSPSQQHCRPPLSL